MFVPAHTERTQEVGPGPLLTRLGRGTAKFEDHPFSLNRTSEAFGFTSPR